MNMDLSQDFQYLRSILSKHLQLMQMYNSHGSYLQAKKQFESVKDIFRHMQSKGMPVDFYSEDELKEDELKYKA